MILIDPITGDLLDSPVPLKLTRYCDHRAAIRVWCTLRRFYADKCGPFALCRACGGVYNPLLGCWEALELPLEKTALRHVAMFSWQISLAFSSGCASGRI